MLSKCPGRGSNSHSFSWKGILSRFLTLRKKPATGVECPVESNGTTIGIRQAVTPAVTPFLPRSVGQITRSLDGYEPEILATVTRWER